MAFGNSFSHIWISVKIKNFTVSNNASCNFMWESERRKRKINNLLKFGRVYWIRNWIAWINAWNMIKRLMHAKVCVGEESQICATLLPVSERSVFVNDIGNDEIVGITAAREKWYKKTHPTWGRSLKLIIQVIVHSKCWWSLL